MTQLEEWTVFYQYRREPRVIYKEKLTRLEAVAELEKLRKEGLATLPSPYYAERTATAPRKESRRSRNKPQDQAA